MDSDVVDRKLRLAWRAFSPDPALRARVHAKLASSGQAPLPAGERSGSAPKLSRWGALRASGKLGAGVGTGIFGLGVLVGLAVPYAARPELQQSAPPPVLLNDASVVERAGAVAVPPPAVAAEPIGDLAPKQQPPPKPAARLAPTPSPASTRDWRGELTLLGRAEKAVRADNSAFALALLAEFDARYPRSTLVEERKAIELMAHCRAKASDAAQRAERFTRAHPNSVYASRIAEMCGAERAMSSEATDETPRPGH